MKLSIGKYTVEEPPCYRFNLKGNKLEIVNIYPPYVKMIFEDGKKYKIIPAKHLKRVQKRLTESKRLKAIS